MKSKFFVFLVIVFSILIGSMAAAKSNLRLVKNENVCMVTNMVFPKKQIPVQVENRTYFGCCEM